MDFKLSDDEMKLIQPEELTKNDDENEAKMGRRKHNLLLRMVDANKK